ncbi:putative short chain dehydrogenase [Daldinia vernicosa]|uniref:putative short chain dehydrogenase n=1 Tax=Daldinia vernicosa TaxID=114800 RepID=UPI002007A0D1|nr:putative short chain dehydrogenase [Daldinia vernicosa]KAI0844098.1 putative short chain dehydrogenase [Daldinia vernicosa]
MSSYVITGVSKGIGYEFVRQLSQDPNNIVIGIVRDRPATVKKISEDTTLKGRSNIYILEADVTNHDALKRAATETAGITGGSLDYLIGNAGYISHFDAYEPLGVLGNEPKKLEDDLGKLINVHVVGNIHLINSFMPLILKGQAKKVIVVSSGFGDLDLTTRFDLDLSSLYSISKAASNMAVAKFSAQYKRDGVLFLSIAPGMVEVGHYTNSTPEQIQKLSGGLGKFAEYAPNFTGPITPEVSVKMVRSVWENASLENGDSGAFLSQYGNKQWL